MTSAVSMPSGHAIVGSDLDAYENLTGTWVDYSASLQWTSSGTAPALGNAVVSARYVQVGKLVIYAAKVTFGSSSTFGTGTYRMSIPVTAAASSPYTGPLILNDASAPLRIGGAVSLNSATNLAFYGVSGSGVTATAPFTWAQDDFLQWSIMYEAA